MYKTWNWWTNSPVADTVYIPANLFSKNSLRWNDLQNWKCLIISRFENVSQIFILHNLFYSRVIKSSNGFDDLLWLVATHLIFTVLTSRRVLTKWFLLLVWHQYEIISRYSLLASEVNPAMVSTVRFYDRNELYGSPDVRNCRMPKFLGWAFFVISLISIHLHN